VIAGEVAGQAGPGSTHTPMSMVHATIAPGAQLELPWRPDFNALVYVMSGDGFVGPNQTPIGTGQLAVLGRGDALRLSAARSQQARHAAGRPATDQAGTQATCTGSGPGASRQGRWPEGH